MYVQCVICVCVVLYTSVEIKYTVCVCRNILCTDTSLSWFGVTFRRKCARRDIGSCALVLAISPDGLSDVTGCGPGAG